MSFFNTDIDTFDLSYRLADNSDWVDREVTAVKNDPIDYVSRDGGETLRGRDYAHTKFSKIVREIEISADYLFDDDNYGFIREFYKSFRWRYSEDGLAHGDENKVWTEVVLKQSGNMPVKYLEEWRQMREVTFTLTDKEPS